MATTEIRKEEVKLPSEFKGCLAFVLYNVFTKEVCFVFCSLLNI